MKKLKTFEQFTELNESLNTRTRSKIVVHLKKHGIIHGEDYEMAGSEFLANDSDTAEDIADAVAGKFKVAIYNERATKDGKIPVMITEGIFKWKKSPSMNLYKPFSKMPSKFNAGGMGFPWPDDIQEFFDGFNNLMKMYTKFKYDDGSGFSAKTNVMHLSYGTGFPETQFQLQFPTGEVYHEGLYLFNFKTEKNLREAFTSAVAFAQISYMLNRAHWEKTVVHDAVKLYLNGANVTFQGNVVYNWIVNNHPAGKKFEEEYYNQNDFMHADQP